MSKPDGTPSEPEYDKMSLEDLDAALARGEGVVVESEEEPEPPVEEPDAEAPEAPSDEPPSDPVVAPDEPKEFDERESQIAELQLQLMQQEQQREKAAFQRDREAGTVGSLKQKLESMEARLAEALAGNLEGEDGERAAKVSPAPFKDSRVDELEAGAKQQRIAAAYSDFVGKVYSETKADLESRGGDVTPEQIQAEHEARVKAIAPFIQNEIAIYKDENLNVRAVEKVTRMAVESAHTAWKIQQLRDQRAASNAKRASQVSDKKREKIAASISSAGATASVQNKRVEDMSADEIDAELTRLHGRGKRRWR